jgi:hypothetical protein
MFFKAEGPALHPALHVLVDKAAQVG